jgi:hypothetical protein
MTKIFFIALVIINVPNAALLSIYGVDAVSSFPVKALCLIFPVMITAFQ